MHGLRCIITADCQLLFNQMYVKRDSSLLSFLEHIKQKKVGRVGVLRIKVDLSYAALRPRKAKLSVQINGIQKPALPFWSASSLDAARRPGRCLHYCARKVWCTRSSRAYVRLFTPAGLCGVPSAERSLSTAPVHPQDNTNIHSNVCLNLTLRVHRTGCYSYSRCLKCLDRFIRTVGAIRNKRCEIASTSQDEVPIYHT